MAVVFDRHMSLSGHQHSLPRPIRSVVVWCGSQKLLVKEGGERLPLVEEDRVDLARKVGTQDGHLFAQHRHDGRQIADEARAGAA